MTGFPRCRRGYVRDLRVRWALEEAGLPYRVESTPFRDRGAEHFAHQPFGQVPWLTDGDISIFESGAILLHLGDRSEALMPADPRGRSEAKEWLFAALNSVEMASLPWAMLKFSGDTGDTPAWKSFDDFLELRLERLEPVLAGREWLAGIFLRRRHPDGGCAAPRGSVRRPGGLSRLPRLCRARHGAPGLREGACRPDGAFCGGGCRARMKREDKKAALAAYKERKPKPGIYVVRCTATDQLLGRRGAGAVGDLEPRVVRASSGRRRSLRRCRAAWNAHGAGELHLRAVEALTDEQLVFWPRPHAERTPRAIGAKR